MLRRVVSFLGVGVAATLTSYVIYLALVAWLGQPLAYAVGYVAGLPIAIFGNLKVTFAARISALTVAATLAVYLLTAAWVSLAIGQLERAGVPAYLSGAIGTGLSIVSNFLGLSLINRRRGADQQS